MSCGLGPWLPTVVPSDALFSTPPCRALHRAWGPWRQRRPQWQGGVRLGTACVSPGAVVKDACCRGQEGGSFLTQGLKDKPFYVGRGEHLVRRSGRKWAHPCCFFVLKTTGTLARGQRTQQQSFILDRTPSSRQGSAATSIIPGSQEATGAD